MLFRKQYHTYQQTKNRIINYLNRFRLQIIIIINKMTRQFRPICKFSGQVASYFCLYQKCQQQPFLCKFCYEQQCNKCHIHKPNNFLMYSPLEYLNRYMKAYKQYQDKEIKIINQMQDKAIMTINNLKSLLDDRIIKIRKIYDFNMNQIMNKLNNKKFQLLKGSNLSYFVTYMVQNGDYQKWNSILQTKINNLNQFFTNLQQSIQFFGKQEKTELLVNNQHLKQQDLINNTHEEIIASNHNLETVEILEQKKLNKINIEYPKLIKTQSVPKIMEQESDLEIIQICKPKYLFNSQNESKSKKKWISLFNYSQGFQQRVTEPNEQQILEIQNHKESQNQKNMTIIDYEDQQYVLHQQN